MPVVSVDPGTATPTSQKAGDSALTVAKEQIGKVYVYGTAGPNTFDCSGLMQYCYLNGPGIQIGRDTTAQWNNTTALTTVFDRNNAQGKTFTADQLENGDLIYYFQPGNSGPNAHVKMYAGGGQTIEAPYTGAVVTYNPVDLVGDTAEPFAGVKRAVGGGSSDSGGGGGNSNSGQGNGNQTSLPAGANPLTPEQQQWMGQALANLKDPRSNLPFSAVFQGQRVPGGPASNGGFTIQTSNGNFMPATQLVRGGMMELVAQQFKCYFMMNPAQIAVDAGVNTSQLSPFQQDPTTWAQAGSFVTSQTVTFSLYFNRMYEVWQGNVKGPSQEGVRWDIRALERLMGVFDASGPGTIGNGNNGWGQFPASMMPVQVVFGGANSMQFQGVIAGLDYTFTRFDSNMIPVEASADVQVMRVYNPESSDVTTPLITMTGQVGVSNLPGRVAFTR